MATHEDIPDRAERLAAIDARPKAGWSIGLSSLMLLVGVAAICLTLIHEDLYVGGAALLVLIPAVTRTVYRVSERQAQGKPCSIGLKILLFVASTVETCIVWLSFSIAFAGVCYSAALGLFDIDVDPRFGIGPVYIAVGLAAAAGAWAAYVAACFFWKSRDRKR